MIHNKVGEGGKVKVKFGDLATLVSSDPSGMLYSSSKSFDALYLGHTPETEKLHGVYSEGEGHLFARLDKDDQISFYLAHNLKMEYWTDGDDDPSYAVGIRADSTTRVNLNSSEREYVFSLLTKRRKEASLAA